MIFSRYSLFLVGLLCCSFHCFSQEDKFNRRDSIRILNSRNHYVDLRLDKRTQQKQIAVSRIEFYDVRYDTTFITLNWKRDFSTIGNTQKDKYDLTGGLAAHLTGYYRYQYRQDTGNHERVLLCFIKQFSILPQWDVMEHYTQAPLMYKDPDYTIRASIECFYRRNDSLYPAIRMDTTYSTHFPASRTLLTDIIEDMLQPFEDKLENMDTVSVFKRKHYSEDVVRGNYTQRFNIPLLTSEHYKTGIYKDFTELRNQTPSIDSFTASLDKMKVLATPNKNYALFPLLWRTIQKRNTTVFLYDAGGELIDPSKVYAYCPDGETIWIQHGVSYYPLVETGNSFEFLYIHHIPITINGVSNTQAVTLLMPLNMETGKSN